MKIGSQHKLCILFDNIGPYHDVRLSGAASESDEVVGLQVFSVSGEYEWRSVSKVADYRLVTVFDKGSPSEVSRCEVARNVMSCLDREQPQYLAVPGWSDIASLAGLLWCIRNRRPAIAMSESTEWDAKRSALKEFLKRRVAGCFSSGLVGGTPHLEYLCKLGMHRDRIFVGYDVVDNEYFEMGADDARSQAARLRNDLGLPGQYFLASARFIPKKNLFRLIEAYAAYRNGAGQGAWKLVLLGDGPLKQALKDHTRKHDVEADVLMPGFKQYSDLPVYYGMAEVFVHASTSEPWGLVVNEAMASGCPVLVSDRCGCACDLVRDGENGYTFDPENVSDIGALLASMTERDNLAEMGKASRGLIKKWSPNLFGKNLWNAADAAGMTKVPRAASALWVRLLMMIR